MRSLSPNPVHALCLAICLVSARNPVAAQEPPLVTDRPDQTESTSTVPVGGFQIETGALFTRDDSGRTERESVQVLATLVRIGLSDRAELRIGFDGFVSERVERTPRRRRIRNEGFGDASIGAKVHLAEERARRPRIALLAATSVPIGDGEVTSDHYDPTLRVAMSKGLSDRLSLGWNLGIDWSGRGETAFYTLSSGLAVGERDGVFLEVFGDDDGSHSLDTGWTRLLTPNVQVDLAIGAGLTDDAPDWFVGAGFSIRVPSERSEAAQGQR